MTQGTSRAVQAGSEIVLSASAISAFLSCPMRFFYRYRRRMQPRGFSAPLVRGSAVHAAVQAWWNGQDIGPALFEWYDSMAQSMLPQELEYWKENDWSRITRLIERYTEYYGRPAGQTVSTEMELSEVIVPGLRVIGYLDLLYTENGIVDGIEIKTARNLTRRMEYLEWDQQPVTYVACLRAMSVPVRGIWFDGINTYPYKDIEKADPERLFRRQLIEPTDEQIAEFRRNCEVIADAIHHADDTGRWARNLGGGCRGCDFQVPCHANVLGDALREEGAWRTRFRERPEVSTR